MCVLPLGHPLLQLPQQVPVELVELRQVVEDLAEDPLVHHRLSVLPARRGNRVPEVLRRQAGGDDEVIVDTHTHAQRRKGNL